jgi:site-specific recombinase XerD
MSGMIVEKNGQLSDKKRLKPRREMPTYTPVWNYRGKVNQCGLYSIHIELYVSRTNRRYYEIPVPLKVAKNEWSGKPDNWVKITHPYAFEINNKISDTLNVLKELNKRYYNMNKPLTMFLILKELNKDYNLDSFNEFFRHIILDPPESLDSETMKRYDAALKKLDKFNRDITFADLSESLFEEFKKFLEQKEGLAPSTIKGYFNACIKVVEWARKDNQITKEHQETIFEDITVSPGKSKKENLSVEQVSYWKNFEFTPKQKTQKRDRDIFLILIYTGWYYNDFKEALKTDLRKDPDLGYYIDKGRYKNDHQAIIPLWLFKNAIPLMSKYFCNDPKSPYLFRRDIIQEDQPFNRNLKKICRIIGWTGINLKNKMGRTTYSQLLIRYGAERAMVPKMMGHEDEKSAAEYFDINLADIIEGVKKVDLGRFDI